MRHRVYSSLLCNILHVHLPVVDDAESPFFVPVTGANYVK